MKLKRSSRLVDLTRYLLQHPHELISLSFFSERYGAAKSSISEDLLIIKENFEGQGVGWLNTVHGAAGGVRYIPRMSETEASEIIEELKDQLNSSERVLPGGYLYMTDIIGNPSIINKVGRMFASMFADRSIDVVMTVATKGIPLAYSVASYLNVPVVIVRSNSRVTEGSTVSINYVSGSTKRIQTMALAKRSLPSGSNVLIVDDFMKAGGTVKGMMDLLQEFEANMAGIGVLVESEEVQERLVDDYISVARLSNVDQREKKIQVESGNYLERMEAADE
jgi:purine operon repressor